MNMISQSFDAPYRLYPVLPAPGSVSGVLHLPRARGSEVTGSLKMRFHCSSSYARRMLDTVFLLSEVLLNNHHYQLISSPARPSEVEKREKETA